MALTDTQKAQVRLYLGFPDSFRYRHTRLESVMDNVSPEAELQIVDLLTKLASVETAIATGVVSGGLSVQLAGIKRVDEIWFETGATKSNYGNSGFKSLKEAGRFFAGRLSIILGVPLNANVFGGAGYPGDTFFPGLGTPINLG